MNEVFPDFLTSIDWSKLMYSAMQHTSQNPPPLRLPLGLLLTHLTWSIGLPGNSDLPPLRRRILKVKVLPPLPRVPRCPSHSALFLSRLALALAPAPALLPRYAFHR